jgi:hypothetical protein
MLEPVTVVAECGCRPRPEECWTPSLVSRETRLGAWPIPSSIFCGFWLCSIPVYLVADPESFVHDAASCDADPVGRPRAGSARAQGLAAPGRPALCKRLWTALAGSGHLPPALGSGRRAGSGRAATRCSRRAALGEGLRASGSGRSGHLPRALGSGRRGGSGRAARAALGEWLWVGAALGDLPSSRSGQPAQVGSEQVATHRPGRAAPDGRFCTIVALWLGNRPLRSLSDHVLGGSERAVPGRF